jgi:hypothetical protein
MGGVKSKNKNEHKTNIIKLDPFDTKIVVSDI